MYPYYPPSIIVLFSVVDWINSIRYRMACRNVGQLITKQTAVFLCDLQEKFRPSIQHFDAIVTVSSRLLKAAKILEVFVLYCLLFKLFIFGFLDPSSRYGTVSKRPRFNSQRAWPRAVSRDQAGRKDTVFDVDRGCDQ